MPIHDWRRVQASTFHSFHTAWITELTKVLNTGVLPPDFYALAEQDAGDTGPDVLTLRAGDAQEPDFTGSLSGATAVLTAPPQVSYVSSLDEEDIYTVRRRTLVIRHASNDRIIAYLEILSPGNKDSRARFERVLDKAVAVLNHGCHLLIIDLFPPGSFDPEGIHGAIWSQFSRQVWRQPADKRLTLAAYTGGLLPRAYVEPVRVGDDLPKMPLFLAEDLYVNVPLEATYREAYTSVPARWRRVVETPAQQ